MIWFKGQDDYEEFDWSGEINQQTMTNAGLCANWAWTRNPVKVEIGTKVTSIGKTAFYECDSLTSITIPSSVSSIGENAFKKGNSLTSMSILGFTQAQIRANASSWGLNTGISITASDGTFTL